jgi:TRAP-type C4-dicarboxylate transport system permease small subunit
MERALVGWWRVVGIVGAVERGAGIGLIALIVVTVTVQVITRYAFGQPLVWVEELATYSFIWAVFLGAALGLKEMRHIRIETFVGRLPERPRALLHAALYLMVGACSAALAVYALDIMQVESRSQTISLPVNVGRHWFYSVPLFTGLASMVLTSAYFVAAYGAAFLTGRPVDAEVDVAAERARDLAADEHEIRIAEKSL